VSTSKKHIHRGQLLEAAVKASRLNIEFVAEKAGYSRSSYYKHKEEKDLDYHILASYGKAIKHDFTEELPEMPKYLIEEPNEDYGKTPTLNEAIKQRDQWKEKYYELLEKYNKLIEEKMKK
jgi:vacuolar-type H+-ATPase subunit I/STV1